MEVNYYERSCTEQAPEAFLRENEFGAKNLTLKKLKEVQLKSLAFLPTRFKGIIIGTTPRFDHQ